MKRQPHELDQRQHAAFCFGRHQNLTMLVGKSPSEILHLLLGDDHEPMMS